MQQGQFIEQGETEQLFNNPQHPYTKTLLRASLLTA
jgi:ABC-type dipeptide/oligopeptide/nickel transport system ATPase component